MKKLSLLCFILSNVLTFNAVGQAFITKWKTDNPGASSNTSITIQTSGAGYNYNVDWNNDGTADETGITGDITHNFGVAGTYTIRITGDFPRMYFSFFGDVQKIVSVEQWGSIAWQTMNSAFADAVNLVINASDAPNLSAVTDMSNMFNGATSLNSSLNSWNVSTITNMSGMFSRATAFNGNITGWNVGAVTNMSGMFAGATVFNQAIGGWNVANVTDMSNMFYRAVAFNQPIGGWNVAAVQQMQNMFRDDVLFNQPLNSWNVSSVTNMSSMFYNCQTFNQPLASWNVSAVVDMSYLFGQAIAFNQNIGGWNIASVLYLDHTFSGASAFNQNIGAWDLTGVLITTYMFEAATSFNQNINGWNVASVTNMNFMFSGATAFNQNLNSWNVSAVTNMQSMFLEATAFNGNIAAWNVAQVTNFVGMFAGASAFNQNIGIWNVSAATHMSSMFSGATAFNQNIGSWNVANVDFMSAMFKGAVAFNQNIGSWDVSGVIDMSEIFAGATAFNQNIGGWNVSAASFLYYALAGATAFNQDISAWNITSADVYGMLDNSGMSVTNYDKLLKAWNTAGYINKSLGSGGLIYCSGETARTNMITNKGWTIEGDTKDCSSLPVTLAAFNAQLTEEHFVQLKWLTANETENAGFEIHKSMDGSEWQAIGFVDGKGTISAKTDYQFIDQEPEEGNNYYRLLQIDFDGTRTFSRIVRIQLANHTIHHIFPNPTTGTVNISSVTNADLKVYGSNGMVLKNLRLTNSMADVTALPAGIYTIEIQTEKGWSFHKVIKQ